MSLRRYNSPFDTLRKLEDEMLSIFNDEDRTLTNEKVYKPLVDLKENENEYKIEANLPGMKKEDIDITVASDYIKLTAEQSNVEEDTDEDDEVIYKERVARKYSRRIPFDNSVDPKSASSSYKEGVIKITVPKSEQSKSVKLEIE